jgi:hypothetical protein
MSKHLGLRAEPTTLHYTVVDIDESGGIVSIDAAESLRIPRTQGEGAILAYVRTHVNSLISEFSIESVGIKSAENNARSISLPRIHMEGVAIEAAHSSNASSSAETLVTMAPVFGVKRNEMKKAIEGTSDLLQLDQQWLNLSEKHREALLASYVSRTR